MNIPFVDVAITMRWSNGIGCWINVPSQLGSHRVLKGPFLRLEQLEVHKLFGACQDVLSRLNAAVEYCKRQLCVEVRQGQIESWGAIQR